MFKPFSKQAQAWEGHALELRRKLGLTRADLLQPTALAPKLGLLVVDALQIRQLLDEQTAERIFGSGCNAWSGGVFATPLPSGERICIINSTHSAYRQKVTLMEEIAHIYLQHSTTKLHSCGDGVRFRDFDEKQEREAYAVGTAALLPWASFFHGVNKGMSVEQLAEMYQVSRELIQYRIKVTGAHKLYQARLKPA